MVWLTIAATLNICHTKTDGDIDYKHHSKDGFQNIELFWGQVSFGLFACLVVRLYDEREYTQAYKDGKASMKNEGALGISRILAEVTDPSAPCLFFVIHKTRV